MKHILHHRLEICSRRVFLDHIRSDMISRRPQYSQAQLDAKVQARVAENRARVEADKSARQNMGKLVGVVQTRNVVAAPSAYAALEKPYVPVPLPQKYHALPASVAPVVYESITLPTETVSLAPLPIEKALPVYVTPSYTPPAVAPMYESVSLDPPAVASNNPLGLSAGFIPVAGGDYVHLGNYDELDWSKGAPVSGKGGASTGVAMMEPAVKPAVVQSETPGANTQASRILESTRSVIGSEVKVSRVDYRGYHIIERRNPDDIGRTFRVEKDGRVLGSYVFKEANFNRVEMMREAKLHIDGLVERAETEVLDQSDTFLQNIDIPGSLEISHISHEDDTWSMKALGDKNFQKYEARVVENLQQYFDLESYLNGNTTLSRPEVISRLGIIAKYAKAFQDGFAGRSAIVSGLNRVSQEYGIPIEDIKKSLTGAAKVSAVRGSASESVIPQGTNTIAQTGPGNAATIVQNGLVTAQSESQTTPENVETASFRTQLAEAGLSRTDIVRIFESLRSDEGRRLVKSTASAQLDLARSLERGNATDALRAEQAFYQNLGQLGSFLQSRVNFSDAFRQRHFAERARRNTPLPSYEAVTSPGSEWVELSGVQAFFHQIPGGVEVQKFVNEDGREAVYERGANGNFTLVTDPRYAGTFNYAVPLPNSAFRSNRAQYINRAIAHGVQDVLPFYLLGGNVQ